MIEIIPYDDEILPIEEAIKLPYYKGLVRIKRVLEKNIPDKACCRMATRIVHLHVGLEELSGKYTAKTYLGERLKRYHAWNYDEERGLYVDVTQDQFLETLSDIVILPCTTDVLTPDQLDTKSQRELTFYKHIDEILRKVQRKWFFLW